MNFLIMAGDFDEKSGGIYSLHLLCHYLNQLKEHAYICPIINSLETTPVSTFGGLGRASRNWLNWHISKKRPLKLASDLQTPVLHRLSSIRNNKSWITVYPETISGNPLNAKNVVRWLLHNPGHFSGNVSYQTNEVHIRHANWQAFPNIIGCFKDLNTLRPFRIPEPYKLPADGAKRYGTAYCLRKGKNRRLAHDTKDSTLIDGLSHEQIAEIFRRVEVFYSYDLYTYYSSLATLCGCTSVVLPEEGLSKEQWQENDEERWGIAYGLDDIPYAKETAHLQVSRLYKLESSSLKSVGDFADRMKKHFGYQEK